MEITINKTVPEKINIDLSKPKYLLSFSKDMAWRFTNDNKVFVVINGSGILQRLFKSDDYSIILLKNGESEISEIEFFNIIKDELKKANIGLP